jgi:hypothetical protein
LLQQAVVAELNAEDMAFFQLYPRRTCYVRRTGGQLYSVTRRIAPNVHLRLTHLTISPPHLTEFTDCGALRLWRQLARGKRSGMEAA